MAPLLLYIVWHSEVLAADVYRSPSGILKVKINKNQLHQLRCRSLRWWQKCLISIFIYSRGGCGVSAFQPRLCLPSKISPSPPGQEAEPSLRLMCWCLRQIGTVVPSDEVLMLCLCVWMTVCVCVCSGVCVHVWCSGLAELQQWLSPSQPNLAPVCWWALLTFALTGCCGLWNHPFLQVRLISDGDQFHYWLL